MVMNSAGLQSLLGQNVKPRVVTGIMKALNCHNVLTHIDTQRWCAVTNLLLQRFFLSLCYLKKDFCGILSTHTFLNGEATM